MDIENVFSISGYGADCPKWASKEIVGRETCYKPGQFICSPRHSSVRTTDSEGFANISNTCLLRIGRGATTASGFTNPHPAEKEWGRLRCVWRRDLNRLLKDHLHMIVKAKE